MMQGRKMVLLEAEGSHLLWLNLRRKLRNTRTMALSLRPKSRGIGWAKHSHGVLRGIHVSRQ